MERLLGVALTVVFATWKYLWGVFEQLCRSHDYCWLMTTFRKAVRRDQHEHVVRQKNSAVDALRAFHNRNFWKLPFLNMYSKNINYMLSDVRELDWNLEHWHHHWRRRSTVPAGQQTDAYAFLETSSQTTHIAPYELVLVPTAKSRRSFTDRKSSLVFRFSY